MSATGAQPEVQVNFLSALSDYSVCIKPFLRTAQDRYIGQWMSADNQPFDFNTYCVKERELVNTAKAQLEDLQNK